MNICPTCNAAVDEIDTHIRITRQGPASFHRAQPLRPPWLSFAHGIAMALVANILGGVWQFAGRLGGNSTISEIALPISLLFISVWAGGRLFRGIKYSKMPDPTRKLAVQHIAFGLGAFLTTIMYFAVYLITGFNLGAAIAALIYRAMYEANKAK